MVSRGVMDDEVERLRVAFTEVFGRAIPFGEPAMKAGEPEEYSEGFSDGNEGVQWNAGISSSARTWLGVNLEGKKYNGWPVARLIERELDSPVLFSAIGQFSDPGLVEVYWYRDSWGPKWKQPIREMHIGCTPISLGELRPDEWRRILVEAQECLDGKRDYRGRGTQTVTFAKSGKKETGQVSPHLAFHRILWSRLPEELSARVATMRRVRTELNPLYDFVTRRSS